MPKISLTIHQDTFLTIATILLTFLIAVIIDNILRSFIKVPKSFENRHTRTYAIMLRKTLTVVIYIGAFYFISQELGFNITPLLASASIIGIVVGIGARALIEDLINGFFLLTQEAIAIGDYIKVDESEGVIEKLGFRTITIRGENGELHIIPNGLVKKVINYSRHRSYMHVDFPVKSDQDIDLTLKAMEEAMDELRRDKQIKDLVFESTSVLGITDYRIDGRIILQARIVTTPEARFKAARIYRYLAKKHFEKYKIALC